MNTFIKNHKIEIAILVLAITARVLLLLVNIDAYGGNIETAVHGADGYFEVSQNLYEGHGFSMDGVSPSPIHVPLYPFFLTLSLLLFGNYIFAVVFQIILGAFIPILAMRLSSKIIQSKKINSFVGFFLALEPNFVFFSVIFFTETLFIFIFLTALLVFIKYLETADIRHLILFTLILGISSLVKTVVQFYPVFLIPVMFWFLKKRVGTKRLLGHALVLVVLFVSVLSPWMYRNYKEFGVPGMTIMPSFNLYVTLAPSVLAIEKGLSFNEARLKFIDDRNIDVGRLTFATAPEFNREAFSVLKKYPLSLVKVSVINVVTFFTHDGMLTVLGNAGFRPKETLSAPAITLLLNSPLNFLSTIKTHAQSPFVLVLLMRIFWIITTLSFLFGMYILFRRGRFTAPVVFALATVLYFAATTPSNGLTVNSRFRMPVTPFILTIAAYPFVSMKESKKYKPFVENMTV